MSEELLGAFVADTSPAVAPDVELLQGQYVVLKRTQESHFPELWKTVGCHNDIFTFWPAGPYNEQAQFDKEMKELLEMPGLLTFTSFVNNEAVGNFMILPASLESRVMEIGLILGPSIQRTRAATEAFYLLAALAFDKHNNRRLEWRTNVTNKPSQKAAERFGLTCEGRLRQAAIQKGRNRDTLWYSMIDKEWPVCKRAFELWLDPENFDESGRQKERLEAIRAELSSEKEKTQN